MEFPIRNVSQVASGVLKESYEVPLLLVLHPRNLRWNLKITQLKGKIIFQTSIFGFQIFEFQRSKFWLSIMAGNFSCGIFLCPGGGVLVVRSCLISLYLYIIDSSHPFCVVVRTQSTEVARERCTSTERGSQSRVT